MPVILKRPNISLLVTVQFTGFSLIDPYIFGSEEPPWDKHISVKFVESQRSLDKLLRIIGVLNGTGRQKKDYKILENMTHMEKLFDIIGICSSRHEGFPPKFPVINYPEFKKIILNILGNAAKFLFCANVFPK